MLTAIPIVSETQTELALDLSNIEISSPRSGFTLTGMHVQPWSEANSCEEKTKEIIENMNRRNSHVVKKYFCSNISNKKCLRKNIVIQSRPVPLIQNIVTIPNSGQCFFNQIRPVPLHPNRPVPLSTEKIHGKTPQHSSKDLKQSAEICQSSISMIRLM